MARSWIVRRSAETDLDEAARWYDNQRFGVGLRFLDAVDLLFDRIRATPLQFPSGSADVRRALLQTFPYAVYFRATDDAVSCSPCCTFVVTRAGGSVDREIDVAR